MASVSPVAFGTRSDAGSKKKQGFLVPVGPSRLQFPFLWFCNLCSLPGTFHCK